jgi:hypothetical protein
MRVLFFLVLIAIVGAKPIVKDESTLKTETTESVEWEEGVLAAESENLVVELVSEKDVVASEGPVVVEAVVEEPVSMEAVAAEPVFIEPVAEIPVNENPVTVKAEKHVKAKPSTHETV